jgi:hypothetical protein
MNCILPRPNSYPAARARPVRARFTARAAERLRSEQSQPPKAAGSS